MAENCTTKSNGQISVQDAQVAVVMVPLSAQGHLNQLLHLSRLITSYNIPVHYVGATTHIRQAKFRVHGFDPVTAKNLHFHEFNTPPFENPPPNPNASNKFPNQLIPSFYATIHLREPVCSLVRQLLGNNHRRVIVIYDSMMTWVVQDVPAIPNAECYRFNSVSAFHTFSFIWEARGKPAQAGTEIFEDISAIEDCATPELWELWSKQGSLEGKISSGELYNSSRVIEGLYLDLVAKESNGLNLWAIGPFNPLLLSEKNKDSNKRHKTLAWLDKQEPDSVIYVSFGTSTSLSSEEIEQLAIGLEKSLQKFIWVLRDADKGDVFEGEERRAQQPEGYEERLKGRGIIVRDWAPQLEILAHPSTGGFMSHCGWNSCMESISMGVPIAAWPMHSDQPRNSQLVTKFLKIGLNVRHWARRAELVTSEIVENAVRTLMASPEGDEMRKRASELSVAVKQSVMGGEGEERRAQLPEGYEERIKGRGMIVRDWAPQLEILAHPSTGGFMSHCGWNSCMESISLGVPIAAWPMHSDQPRNSQLVTKFLKIGLIVRHWARRDELVTSEIVENAVRTLMASPEGDEMRKRASELSISVKQAVMGGEGNGAEMDSFIAHITR